MKKKRKDYFEISDGWEIVILFIVIIICLLVGYGAGRIDCKEGVECLDREEQCAKLEIQNKMLWDMNEKSTEAWYECEKRCIDFEGYEEYKKK